MSFHKSHNGENYWKLKYTPKVVPLEETEEYIKKMNNSLLFPKK